MFVLVICFWDPVIPNLSFGVWMSIGLPFAWPVHIAYSILFLCFFLGTKATIKRQGKEFCPDGTTFEGAEFSENKNKRHVESWGNGLGVSCDFKKTMLG